MFPCLIAVGSNLGDREATIRAAAEQLAAHPQVKLVAMSSLYATAPVGGPAGQDEFLNAAIRIDTSLSPHELLQLLQAIETQLGRTRTVHWGPRTIDLDLLLYGDQVIADPDLKVPHPLMHERHFVLEPAAEIAATMMHPTLHRTVNQLLDSLNRNRPSSDDDNLQIE
jgi:2-amino-4-hydroxy-6-hydroxymethyldihydropteridine diphosphokinase